MGKIRTHYDNLKVARNAPQEVIRAAYRTLSQKYHPDINPKTQEAHRIMGILNAAYEILSDPIKRKDYDERIAKIEAERENFKTNVNSTSPPPHRSPSPPVSPNAGAKFDLSKHISKSWGWYLIPILFILVYATNSSTPNKHIARQKDNFQPATRHVTNNTPITFRYIRPATAPNGQPWPNKSGYIKGYKRFNTNGLSTVTIDNSQNDSDVFVKLVFLDGKQLLAVRLIYIAPRDKFTMNNVRSGNYDVRYRDIEAGSLLKSESFQLKEIHLEDGIRYSNISMTLYKVYNGNMRTTEISETEFGIE
ncbi:MAG: J domain-containing protein [Nitrospirae bacterium]|nr:J domain-containing protein [Nitrospirota bacterium]MBI3377470.1 J domain-containing protein [Nitrospirota bacterium]